MKVDNIVLAVSTLKKNNEFAFQNLEENIKCYFFFSIL